MNSRHLLLLGLLFFVLAPAVAEEQSVAVPVPEVTDLYPPFDDGLPSETLDLMDLISRAATHNPELEPLRDSWRIAQAVIPQVRSVPDPMLSMQYAQIPGFANPQFVHQGYVQVGVSQVLPGFGKIPAKTRVAELEVKVRHRLYEERLNGIFTELRKKLVELYLIENYIQIKRKHQLMIDHLIRVANIKYSVGKGAQPDVVMAQTERTKLESEIAELWGRRKQLQTRIKYLTGSETLPEGRAPEPVPLTEVELEHTGLLDTARLYRPQLWALRAQIEKAKARRRLAQTQDNPDITLALMSRWFQYQPDGLMLTMSMPLPFFNQEKYEYAVVEQDREIEKAEAMYREALAMIEYGVSDKLVAIATSDDQYKILRDTLQVQARQLFRGALKSYETGQYDFTSLIRAQHTLLGIELSLVKYQTDSALAFVDIEGLIGVVMVPTYPDDQGGHF
jgi:outer membrane protein, heavy metal efflux system